MSRWWGLDRRQTVLALVGAVLVGALVVAVANLVSTSDTLPAARPEVWVFGTRTVAAPPTLLGTRDVPGTAFGSVVGAPGRVWMYDPGSHQLGYVESATSRIERLPGAPGGSNFASTQRPLIAPLGRDLWLTPSPGVLARYDVDRRRVVARIGTDSDPSNPDTADSAVVSAGGRIVVAATGPGGIEVHVVDPSSGSILPGPSFGTGGGERLTGLVADGRHVWILTDTHVVRIDVSTAFGTQDVTLQPGDGAVGGAVVARHDLYLLRGADQLVRVRPDGSSEIVSQLRGTGNWPPALNASLTAGAGQVFALVPVGVNENDHSTRLLGFDARLGRATRSLEFSSAFFAGGIAFSTR